MDAETIWRNQRTDELYERPEAKAIIPCLLWGMKWECPLDYTDKRFGIDLARRLERGSYWTNVLIRAQIMHGLSHNERVRLIEYAKEAQKAARKKAVRDALRGTEPAIYSPTTAELSQAIKELKI